MANDIDVDSELDTVQQRLLLEKPSLDHPMRLVVVCWVYQTLKNGHLGKIYRADTTHNYAGVLSMARSLALAYASQHPPRM